MPPPIGDSASVQAATRSIVEPHVNIGASLSFERRGFLVQRLKRMGGARQLAQRRRAKWAEVGRSGSFFFAEFYPLFFPAPVHRLVYLSSEFLA
jgi:hypothetical protein